VKYTKKKEKESENCNLFYDHDSLRRVNLSSLSFLQLNVEIIIIIQFILSDLYSKNTTIQINRLKQY
jgi:hypothetical protein